MTGEANRVSFLPSDQVVGGSLSDIDARIHRARFGTFNYRGKADSVCALLVTYIPDGVEVDLDDIPEHYTQAYSCGPLDKYTPSDDGKYVIAASSAKGFNKSSNVSMFFTALVNKGFPVEKLGQNDISLLDDMRVHLVQVSQPKRDGLKGASEGDEKKGIVLIDRILEMPGEGTAQTAPAAAAAPAKAKKEAKPAAAGAAAGPAAAASKVSALDPEIVAAAQGKILELASAAGGSITKASIAGSIYKALVDETNPARKNAIIQAAYADTTLKNGPWTYDGMTVTLG